MSKSEDDCLASLAVLEFSDHVVRTGRHRQLPRRCPTELRKLLCDDDPLLTRVCPGFKLHKLHWTEVLEESPTLANGLETLMPGRLSVSANGNSHFELLFAKSCTLMDSADWIQQPFLSPSITIRDLIKSVADKEGAHSRSETSTRLSYARSCG